MIEIVDGVLELLEHVLLALAVAGDVGNGPHRRSGLAGSPSGRTVPKPPRGPARPAIRTPPAAAAPPAPPCADDRPPPTWVADEHALDRRTFSSLTASVNTR
jgi:hypothetical protein